MDDSAKTRQPELRHEQERSDYWRDLLAEPYVPALDDLDLLQNHTAGHDCHRLTSVEGYFAACSCGWGSIETDYLGPMLRQVKDHLDTARQAHTAPSTSTTAAPAPDQPEHDANQPEAITNERVHEAIGREMWPDEGARELGALAESQQKPLLQAVGRSHDPLPSGAQCLDHGEAALTRAEIRASAQSVCGLQRELGHAKELRKRIAATAAALAMIEEEIAWVAWAHHPSASTEEYRRITDEASKSAGQARETERTFSY